MNNCYDKGLFSSASKGHGCHEIKLSTNNTTQNFWIRKPEINTSSMNQPSINCSPGKRSDPQQTVG